MRYVVPSEMKALDALRQIFPDSSRRTLQSWIEAKRFTVDGKLLYREDTLLKEGQVVMAQTSCKRPVIPGIPVLFEDRYLIAIDKPYGLLSVPLDGERAGRHALGLLRRYLETDQIYAVHRIDRETSGVLIFAKGKQSEEKMKDLFEAHDLKRQYFAIVEGSVKEDKGSWNAPLKELPSYHVIEAEDGKEATTYYEVQRRSNKYSYLHLQLETGRKHQIRVHCRIAGHPVVGDERYGSTEDPLGRLCLHSCYLEFTHPFTKKKISIASPLPHKFKILGGSLKNSA